MRDPLRELLARLEAGPAVAGDDDRRRFPPGGWAALVAAGLLEPTEAAKAVPCEACDDPHAGEVVRVGGRWRVRCPRYGAVAVPEDRVRRWAVVPAALGRVVSSREPVERRAGRVWELGPVRVGEADRPGWLVVGWRGAVRLAELVPELAHPTAAVFVPGATPPASTWGEVRPLVVPLAAVLTLSAGGLAVNPAAVAAHLPVGVPTVLGAGPPGEPAAVFLSAAELARRVGRDEAAVDTFLRRYRKAHPDCFTEVPDTRKNEPRVLYRTADVWQPLVGWAARKRPAG